MKKTALYLMLAVGVFAFLPACAQEEEGAGDAMEEAMDDAGDAVEEATEEASDAVEEAADEVEDATPDN